MAMLKVLVAFASIVLAFLGQSLIGVLAMDFSSAISPGQITILGMVGFGITPHPLAFGLLLWPFTSFWLFVGLRKALRTYGKWPT